MRVRVLWLGLLLSACSTPHALDRKPMSLSPDERAQVAKQVEAARRPQVGDWTAAWNQAVDASLGRAVLEGIALDALADEAGVAEAMLDALKDKYGGLSPEARRRVDALTGDALAARDHARALEIQLLTAEDAPEYAGAWRVYAEAPPDVSASLLETLRKAREK